MLKNLSITNSIFILLTIILLLAISPFAFAEVEDMTPQNMDYSIEYKQVDRVEVLQRFFERYNSPLMGTEQTFVSAADTYGIDYKLLPAISCMESSCGKQLIEGSFNPFGWGVYGDQHIAFASYDEAIERVAEGLNEGYFAKGFDSIYKIAPIYTPPNSVNWAKGVSFFSNQMEDIALSM